LARPDVRLTILGVILLLFAGLVITSSVWTLPLVIVGGLMVVIGWVGHRVDGRFAIQWGQAGTQLDFRVKVRAARHARVALTGAAESPNGGAHAAAGALEEEVIIDGEAHTVEVDVEELKALVAAVEARAGEHPRADAPPPGKRTLRIAHGGTRASESPR